MKIEWHMSFSPNNSEAPYVQQHNENHDVTDIFLIKHDECLNDTNRCPSLADNNNFDGDECFSRDDDMEAHYKLIKPRVETYHDDHVDDTAELMLVATMDECLDSSEHSHNDPFDTVTFERKERMKIIKGSEYEKEKLSLQRTKKSESILKKSFAQISKRIKAEPDVKNIFKGPTEKSLSFSDYNTREEKLKEGVWKPNERRSSGFGLSSILHPRRRTSLHSITNTHIDSSSNMHKDLKRWSMRDAVQSLNFREKKRSASLPGRSILHDEVHLYFEHGEKEIKYRSSNAIANVLEVDEVLSERAELENATILLESMELREKFEEKLQECGKSSMSPFRNVKEIIPSFQDLHFHLKNNIERKSKKQLKEEGNDSAESCIEKNEANGDNKGVEKFKDSLNDELDQQLDDGELMGLAQEALGEISQGKLRDSVDRHDDLAFVANYMYCVSYTQIDGVKPYAESLHPTSLCVCKIKRISSGLIDNLIKYGVQTLEGEDSEKSIENSARTEILHYLSIGESMSDKSQSGITSVDELQSFRILSQSIKEKEFAKSKSFRFHRDSITMKYNLHYEGERGVSTRAFSDKMEESEVITFPFHRDVITHRNSITKKYNLPDVVDVRRSPPGAKWYKDSVGKNLISSFGKKKGNDSIEVDDNDLLEEWPLSF